MAKKAKEVKKEITIIGYVTELDEDDEGESVKISTDDDDYIVEMNKQGKKLLDLMDRDVEATGTVQNDKDGNKVITVSSFEVLEDDDDFDDDEDDDY